MKFVSFQSADGVKLGVVTDKGIVDVRAVAEKAGLNAPSTIEEVIATGDTAINQIQQVLSQSNEFIDEAEITYAPAIQKPGKIICAGANYLAHVAESNINVPEFPIYFPKYQSSLAAHNEAIVPPSISKQIDYEVELVAIIGKQAKISLKKKLLIMYLAILLEMIYRLVNYNSADFSGCMEKPLINLPQSDLIL